jgi:hypothetical protein
MFTRDVTADYKYVKARSEIDYQYGEATAQ